MMTIVFFLIVARYVHDVHCYSTANADRLNCRRLCQCLKFESVTWRPDSMDTHRDRYTHRYTNMYTQTDKYVHTDKQIYTHKDR